MHKLSNLAELRRIYKITFTDLQTVLRIDPSDRIAYSKNLKILRLSYKIRTAQNRSIIWVTLQANRQYD